MRIRTIKPDFFKHEKISDLKPLARLLFISLWCLADRRGRLEDRPKRIKVECLPYDDCDADDLLWEIHNAGFIERYEIEGVKIIEVLAFEKHQRISGKEADYESALPGRQPGSTREAPGKQLGASQVVHGIPGREREGNRKGTGKEGVQGEGSGSSGEATGKQPGSTQEQNGLPAIDPGTDSRPTEIPKGAQAFIDLWNEEAAKSGLAKIQEWTEKRAKRLRALAATYKATMAESMPLAIKECHKAAWCVQNRAGVDHILVPDNFQRYLDKARTEGKEPAPEAGVRPKWVLDKIDAFNKQKQAKEKEKRKFENEGRVHSAALVQKEIEGIELEIKRL